GRDTWTTGVLPGVLGSSSSPAIHYRPVRSQVARVADRRSCRSEGDGDMSEDPGRSYRESVVTAGEPPETAAAAVRLGFALRRLSRLVTGSDAPDQALDEAADEIERLADRLEPHAQPSRYPQAGRLGGPSGMFVT